MTGEQVSFISDTSVPVDPGHYIVESIAKLVHGCCSRTRKLIAFSSTTIQAVVEQGGNNPGQELVGEVDRGSDDQL